MPETLPYKVRFLILFATRLHAYGASSYRLEGAVSAVSDALNLECNIFCGPTSCMISVQDLDRDDDDGLIPTKVIRMEPGDIDLARLVEVDQIADRVIAGELLPSEGHALLRDMDSSSGNKFLNVLAHGVASGGVAVMLGARWADMLIAFLAGCTIGLVGIGPEILRKKGAAEPVSAFLASLLVLVCAAFFPGVSQDMVIIAGLIVLMPGLGLTTAAAELATNHLVSGSARLAGAATTLLKLTFGVVLGTKFAASLPLTAMPGQQAPMPDWMEWPALLLAAWAFAALFRANLKDMPACMFAAIWGYLVSKYAALLFDPDFAVFMAGLVIASLGNLYARIWKRPASLFRLPGIILLVPGSIGYRGTALVFERDVLTGLDTVFAALIVVASLVAGLLFGNMLVAPRRSL